MIKRILFITLLIATSCKTSKLPPEKLIEKLGTKPYVEIDGQAVNRKDIAKYSATDIASFTIYYNKDATNRFGEKAKDGAVTVETNKFATNKYESLFKTFSADFEKMINETNREEIQYILNDSILKDNFEGNLASLSKKRLKEIKIIDQKELLNKFKIQNKKIGVIIRAKKTKNINRKRKF